MKGLSSDLLQSPENTESSRDKLSMKVVEMSTRAPQLKILLEVAKLVFSLYLVIKYSYYTLLLYRHIIASQEPGDKGLYDESRQTLLKDSGVIYRKSLILGILDHLFHITVPICFYFPDLIKIIWNKFNCPRLARQERFSKWLMNGQKEYHLTRVMNSSKIFNIEKLFTTNGNHSVQCLRWDMKNEPSFWDFWGANLATEQSFERERNIKLLDYNKQTSACRIVSVEQDRIHQLLAKSNSLKLANCVVVGHVRPKRMFLTFHLVFWVIIGLEVGAFQYLALQSLDDSSLNIIEYFTIIDNYLLILFGTFTVAPKLADCIYCFMLQKKALKEIESDFRSCLRRFALEYEMLEARADSLEIYIKVQMFAENLNSYFKIISPTMFETIVFFLMVTLPSILLYRISMVSLESSHITMLTISATGIFITVISIFFAYSTLCSMCLRVIKLAWPLIASSVQIAELNHQQFNHSYNCNFLMSEHTQLLWSRFMGDRIKLLDLFSHTLFGLIRLDHPGVIRLTMGILYVIILLMDSNQVLQYR